MTFGTFNGIQLWCCSPHNSAKFHGCTGRSPRKRNSGKFRICRSGEKRNHVIAAFFENISSFYSRACPNRRNSSGKRNTLRSATRRSVGRQACGELRKFAALDAAFFLLPSGELNRTGQMFMKRKRNT
jgi:hypothetical protein